MCYHYTTGQAALNIKFLPPSAQRQISPRRSAQRRLTPRPQPLYLPPFMNRNPHVAVVGATGAVGIEMIKTLEKRNFPVGKLTLLASARSVGKKLKFRGAGHHGARN